MFSFSLDKFAPVHFLRVNFSGKWIAILCFVIALVNKIIISWFFTDLEGDKSLYLLFTKSLLSGHSLVEPVNIIDGSKLLVDNPASISPLYSLLSVPFLWLSGSYYTTSILMDASSWMVFLLAAFKVGQVIFKEQWITNLFVLSTGFFIYPHQLDSTPKDTLAIGLILWSVYFAHQFLKKSNVPNALVVVAFLWLFALTKFAYVPLLFVSFCLLLFLCRNSKQKNLRLYLAAFFLALVVLPYYWFFVYVPSAISPAGLVSDGTVFIKGFYPQNLLASYPFIISSIINTNFWGVQLEDIFNIPFYKFTHLFQLVDILLLTGIVFLFGWVYKINRLPLLLFYSLVLSAAIAGQLWVMSLIHYAWQYKGGPGSFTFAMEGRSFFFPIISLQLLFFFLLFRTRSVAKGLKNFLFFLFVIECMHGAYFTVKQVRQHKAIAMRSTHSSIKKITTAILDLSEKTGPVSLITSDNHLRRYALLNNIPTYTFLNKPCTSSVVLKGGYIVATHEEDSLFLKQCFASFQLYPLDTVAPFILHSYKKE
jgi:hypothetical protein